MINSHAFPINMKLLFCIGQFVSLLMCAACSQNGNNAANQITEITLERVDSFSQLPNYKVTLRSDETVTYIGKAFAKKQGTHQGKLDKHYFYKLTKLIESQGYFRMQDRYPEDVIISDGWDATVRVTRGGKEKRVFDNAEEGPIELWGIEMAIDAAVDRVRWETEK